MKHVFSLFIASLLIFSSCKKEKTTWSTDWNAPLVHGHLTLEDLIPPEYIETNSENYLSLVYNESVYEIAIDTVLTVPDTTIEYKYAIGISSFNFNPMALLPADTLDQDYDMQGLAFKRVIVKEGTGYIAAGSEWPGKTQLSFLFPRVYENGTDQFARTYYAEPGSTNNPSWVEETIDMENMDMDLTGYYGTEINTLGAIFQMGSNEEVDQITVTSADTITYRIEFRDVVPKYGKGYFGQHHFSDTVGLKIPFMDKILNGTINIDSINLNLSINNGFNMLAQARITKITGVNSKTMDEVDLAFPNLGSSLNINPASGGIYDYVPSSYPLNINTFNSNIAAFIANMPDSIVVGFEIDINPYGNISGGSDEFFPGSTMELHLNGEFPLSFSANQLTLTDTFSVDFNQQEQAHLDEANLFLEYVNAFPLEANATVYLLDAQGAIIDSIAGDTPIESGIYQPSTYITNPATGNVVFILSRENITNLEIAEKLKINVSFESYDSGAIKIDDGAYFDFNLRSNLAIDVSI